MSALRPLTAERHKALTARAALTIAFGVPVETMGRDDLLALVGLLIEERDETERRHAHERDMLAAVPRRLFFAS